MLNRLKEGGKAVFLLPHYFFNIKYGRTIRNKNITQDVWVEQVIMLPEILPHESGKEDRNESVKSTNKSMKCMCIIVIKKCQRQSTQFVHATGNQFIVQKTDVSKQKNKISRK